MAKRSIKLIIDNVRSAYNVGSIFRSAEVFGVDEVILTGISPYPKVESDTRSPQVVERNERMIAKTALDAQKLVPYRYIDRISKAVAELKASGHHIYALEQTRASTPISQLEAEYPCALIVGHELDGVNAGTLKDCDAVIEIPQLGQKESLNVSVAAGIALFELVNR